jgi:amino acid transporter
MSDDKKDAVNIGVTLSSQLITAALAMIAVIGTFGTFIIDKRDVSIGYYLIVSGAFLCFVFSIFFGGKGIDKARKDGFNSNWNLTNTKSYFNLQSITCFIGIVLFAISVFSGKQKADDVKNSLTIQAVLIEKLMKEDSLTKVSLMKLSKSFDSLSTLNSHTKAQPLHGK